MGYVTNNTDCFDGNDDVFPGQTAFFTSPFVDRDFDYNCDGSSERQYSEGICRGGTVVCTLGVGYMLTGPRAPTCGQPMQLVTSCTRACEPETTASTMACR